MISLKVAKRTSCPIRLSTVTIPHSSRSCLPRNSVLNPQWHVFSQGLSPKKPAATTDHAAERAAIIDRLQLTFPLRARRKGVPSRQRLWEETLERLRLTRPQRSRREQHKKRPSVRRARPQRSRWEQQKKAHSSKKGPVGRQRKAAKKRVIVILGNAASCWFLGFASHMKDNPGVVLSKTCGI